MEEVLDLIDGNSSAICTVVLGRGGGRRLLWSIRRRHGQRPLPAGTAALQRSQSESNLLLMTVFEHDRVRQNGRVGSREVRTRRRGAKGWGRVGGNRGTGRNAAAGIGVAVGIERIEMVLQGLILLLELLDHDLHLFHEDALAIAGALGMHAIALAADLIELGGGALGPVLAEELVVDAVIGQVALGIDGGVERLGWWDGCCCYSSCHHCIAFIAADGGNDGCRCCLANLFGTVLTR